MDLRLNLRLEATPTAGDYTRPVWRREVIDRILAGHDEINYRRVEIAAAGTLNLNSNDLRGGVADVLFILASPSGVCEVSRAGGAGEVWRIGAAGWFMIELAAGQVTDFRFVNQAGAEITLDLYIGGD